LNSAVVTKKCNNVADKLFGPKSGPLCGDYLLVTIEFIEVKASEKAPAALAVAPLHVVAPVAAAAVHVKAPSMNREVRIRSPTVAKVELAEAGVKPIDLTADSDDDGSGIISSTSAGAARGEGGSAGIVRAGTIEID
jgi:hypothetical protein